MTEEDYFNKIDEFQKEQEQEEQKKRGLNNYNVMSAIRKIHEEVGMHSNFIYSLLDNDKLNYQSIVEEKVEEELKKKFPEKGETYLVGKKKGIPLYIKYKIPDLIAKNLFKDGEKITSDDIGTIQEHIQEIQTKLN